MTSLLLVRHGHTGAVGERLVGRRPNVPLDAIGRAQAERLAAFFARAPLAAVYASPLERTADTAQAIAARHGLGVSLSDALLDLDFGSWTDRRLEELRAEPGFQRFNTHRAGVAPPTGEHPALMQSRMAVELCRLRDAHPGQLVAVVGHADPLRAAIAYFVGIPLDLARRLELEPGGVSWLELTVDDASLRYLNRAPEGLRWSD